MSTILRCNNFIGTNYCWVVLTHVDWFIERKSRCLFNPKDPRLLCRLIELIQKWIGQWYNETYCNKQLFTFFDSQRFHKLKNMFYLPKMLKIMTASYFPRIRIMSRVLQTNNNRISKRWKKHDSILLSNMIKKGDKKERE